MPHTNTKFLSVENDDIEKDLDQLYLDMNKSHLFKSGFAYFKHFIDDIFSAIEEGGDPAPYIDQARNAGVPEGLVKSALDYARMGFEYLPGFDRFNKMFADVSSDYSHYQVYTPDPFFEAALTGGSYQINSGAVQNIRAGKIWDRLLHYIWQGSRIKMVTKSWMVNQKTNYILTLNDFVSDQGDVYFEMLAETIKNVKAEQIVIKGLPEVLALFSKTVKSPDGINILLVFMALVQGMALQNNLSDTEVCQNLKDGIQGRINSILRPAGNMTQEIQLDLKSINSDVENHVKNAWYQVDLNAKKGMHGSLLVVVDDEDILSLQNDLALADQINVIGAMQRYVLGALDATFTISPDTSIDQLKAYLIESWGQGVQHIDFYRQRSGWDEPLLSIDYANSDENKCYEAKVS